MGGGCDDGDACTAGETCEDADCTQGAAVDCDDGNLCSDDACDAAAGCTHDANKASCSDGDLCTQGDACDDGACVAGAAVDCDDANDCTADACAADAGCQHGSVVDGGVCSDGSKCTPVDGCEAGACVGVGTLACDDGKGCTDDACDAVEGCVAVPNAATCTDGDSCTLGDACSGGVCAPGPTVLGSTNYGGNAYDVPMAIAQLDDGGGFVIGGSTRSTNLPGSDKTTSDKDFWLVRTDDHGVPLWTRVLGGEKDDEAFAVATLPGSGGFLMAGVSNSPVLPGGLGTKGLTDGWLVQIDAQGGVGWHKVYGGSKDDGVRALVVLPGASGMAMAGWTSSADLPGGVKSAGVTDFWLIRTDNDGLALWSRTYGGKGSEEARALVALPGAGGFAIAGSAMSTDLPGGVGGAGSSDFWLVRTDDQGELLWHRTHGSSGGEVANALALLPDGGFVLAGKTNSTDLQSDPKVAFNSDFWIVRTDAWGERLWSRTIGGDSADEAHAIAVLPGVAGLALVGETRSDTLPGGSKPQGDADAWLMRLDLEGNLLWHRALGGNSSDLGVALIARADGTGLVTVGTSNSKSAMPGGGSSNAGEGDFWLLRTDAWGHTSCAEAGGCLGKPASKCDDGFGCTADLCDSDQGCAHATLADGSACGDGDVCTTGATCLGAKCTAGKAKTWHDTFGGALDDRAEAIVALPDGGGYAIAGETRSYDLPGGEKSVGQNDFWLARLDASGALLWNHTYGGKGYDLARAVAARPNGGGFVLAGESNSTDLPGGVAAKFGYDFWAITTDDAGTLQWSRTWGGSDHDRAYATIGLGGDGYAFAGETRSYDLPGGATTKGGYDFWLVRTDGKGDLMWSHTYGGGGDDSARAVLSIGGGDGFALGGSTASVDLPGGGTTAGKQDFWLVRTDKGGALVWHKTYGGVGDDVAYALVKATKSGFALAGRTDSGALPGGVKTTGAVDIWLVRTDSAGNLLWSQTYGGTSNEYGFGLTQLPGGGGFAIAGWTSSVDLPGGGSTAGNIDFWLVRVDAWGNHLWNRAWGGGNVEIASALVAVPGGGGFVVAGKSVSLDLPDGVATAGKDDAWVVRSDAWGNLGCAAAGDCAGVTTDGCDDDNSCTADLCTKAAGCSYSLIADGGACATGKTCAASVCQ